MISINISEKIKPHEYHQHQPIQPVKPGSVRSVAQPNSTVPSATNNPPPISPPKHPQKKKNSRYHRAFVQRRDEPDFNVTWRDAMPREWGRDEGRNGGGGGAALLGYSSSAASWLYRRAAAPARAYCGAERGPPPVTAARVRLRDCRHLAYHESGVAREAARVRVVFSHGFTGSRLDGLGASQVKLASTHAWLHV